MNALFGLRDFKPRKPVHDWVDKTLKPGPPLLSAARLVRDATGAKPIAGTDRNTNSRCSTRPKHRCSATFPTPSFDYYGVHSRFFRRDGKFLVETDGPDGKLATFEVKYTFGLDPLQQYLVQFPRRTFAGAVARLGQPAQGQGRPALVPFLSERSHPPRRSAALVRRQCLHQCHAADTYASARHGGHPPRTNRKGARAFCGVGCGSALQKDEAGGDRDDHKTYQQG